MLLRETYRWYLRYHNFRPLDYTFEDRLLAHAQAAAAAAASARPEALRAGK